MFKRTKVQIKNSKLYSKANLLIFALLFAVIGTYLIINSFAATGTGLNTSAANIFISATGSDSATNCKRYPVASATPPTANTVCATAARAYELMSNGDTAWILPGSYGTAHAWDFEVNAPNAFKPSVGSDCNAAGSKSCFYFIPQPGKEVNVTAGNITTNDDNGPGFKPDKAPDNLYFANFVGPRMCPSFSSTADSITGFHQDITVANFKGTDCTPYISGPWGNIRITGADIAYNCDTEGTAGGWQIQSNQNPNGLGGEATDHRYAPHDLLIANNKIHDFTINGCGPVNPHEDCIHVYAWYNATVENNTFDNCFDSSILVGGLDEPGFNENVVIQNNWFGPTILGANNCCLRGDTNPSSETFDGYIIRFNTSTSAFMNKTGNVLNNVSFIGNIGLGDNVCRSGTNFVWKYNIYGSPSSKCDPTDTAGATNTTVKLINLNNSSLDLRLQTGSIADGFVPTSLVNGCNAVSGGKDIFGNLRSTTGNCDAGAHELGGVPPPTGQTANLWVDSNGGSCARQATAAVYSDSTACASFDSAYKAANPGDTVLVKAKSGGYGDQTITTDTSKASAADYVVIKAEPGQTVSAGTISVGNPDRSSGAPGYWVEFADMKTSASHMSVGSHHIRWRNIDTNWVGLKDASFVSFIGGSVCCNVDIKGLYATGGNPGSIEQPHDILIDGVTFNDTSRNPNMHVECIALWGFYNVTVRNSRFYHCGVYDISATEALSPHTDYYVHDWLVENNFFDTAYNTISGTTDTGDADLFFEAKNAGSRIDNVLVRNNSFSGYKPYIFSTFGHGTSNIHIIGNVVGGGTTEGLCQTVPGTGNGNPVAFTSIKYNVFTNTDCGDTTNLQQPSGFVSVNPGASTGSDLHLLSTSKAISTSNWSLPSGFCPNSSSYAGITIAGKAVPQLTTDIDGETRPQGSSCDAGADEYKSAPTPTKKPGDTNADNVVDIIDLSTLLSKWNTNYTNADFNNDQTINIFDLSILLSNYGK